MEDQTSPTDFSLNIQESDEIAEVFVGYRTTDGEEIILTSAELPVRATLQSSKLQTE
ncbi:hypothetical protein KTS45_18840 [Halomicroarcula limicola]|uniref:Uncharacterized protein n=1 Tax=Haloarcula limicola TaxID=1429915 RepID=A0A8J7YD32_9EURY|nr:hypothetical protein [Halomicroarcula limicola]MBV0926268.1 hypothetical protein [Halomicroarcula limicola]